MVCVGHNCRKLQIVIIIVVFKQEATAQESKKINNFLTCVSYRGFVHAVDLYKKFVKKMGNVGPILHE